MSVGPVRAVPTALVAVLCALAAAPALAGRYPLGEAVDAVSSPVSPANGDVAVLDFDGDGDLDLAVTGAGKLELWLGTPIGWGASHTVPVPGDASGRSRAVAGDFTGDGRDDLLVAQGPTAVLVRGREDGVVGTPQSADILTVAPRGTPVTPGETALDAADLDGDGDLDAVIAYGTAAGGDAVVLVNSGQGTLTEPLPHLGVQHPQGLALVRLGGDRDPDLVIAERPLSPSPAPGDPPLTAALAVFPGAAGPGFGPRAPVDAGPGPLVDVDAGDFDGDGAEDLVLMRERGRETLADVLTILRGEPNAPSFAAPHVAPSEGLTPPIVAGDLDRDGADDLYTSARGRTGEAQGRRLLRGNGDLTFGSMLLPAFFDGDWAYGATRLADVDDDGALDAIELAAQTVYPYAIQAQVRFGLWPLIRPEPRGAAGIDLGTVLLGASSPSRTLTFANDGPDTATEATVLVAGDIAEFTLDRDTCSGSTLAVDATCTITARFAPRTAGRYELSLAVAGAESDEIEWSPTLFGVGAQPAGGGSPLAPPPSSAQTTAPQRAPAATLKRAGAPRVRRHGRRATLDTGWRVACHAGPAPCTAAVTVSTVTTRTRKSTVLAHAVDSVPAGAERKLVLDLSRTGASALRRRSGLSAALDVTVTQTGASATIAHAPLRLRWPRRG